MEGSFHIHPNHLFISQPPIIFPSTLLDLVYCIAKAFLPLLFYLLDFVSLLSRRNIYQSNLRIPFSSVGGCEFGPFDTSSRKGGRGGLALDLKFRGEAESFYGQSSHPTTHNRVFG